MDVYNFNAANITTTHFLCNGESLSESYTDAKVAESVDALVLGASGVTRGSSSLPFRTNPDR